MTPEIWLQVRTLVETALLLPAAERERWLEAHVPSPELLEEVRQLLAFAADASALLSLDKLDQARVEALQNDAVEGTVVGNYRILRELGRGGMGAVYLAERADGEYTQRVAIKILQDHLSTAALVRRFREERQILASLSHPGIAHLLDGGVTAGGRPYLALDYVEGVPIDRFCTDHNLSVPQILRLFLQVAEAVQSAHQALVLHLDLKPANILVTEEGQPRLLDFGIARWLETKAEGHHSAEATLRLLTPRYASPEQASGAPLGVASDVFSLATLLYKMLTGTLPYALEDASPFAAAEILRTTPPAAPSTLAPPAVAPQLRGDLDTILLQALRKEPARRYPTVAAFAEDVQRHLDSRPVLAHADSFGYRAAKFFRRNRLPVSIAAAAALLLAASAAAVVHSGIVARRDRAAAQRSLSNMRELTHSYTIELIPELDDIPGTLQVSHKVMDHAVHYLDLMSHEPSSDMDFRRELALACVTLGRLKGSPFTRSLGDRPGALALYDRGIAIQLPIAAANPNDRIDQSRLADLYRDKASVYIGQGEIQRGAELDQRAWELSQMVLRGGPTGNVYVNVYNVAWHQGGNQASSQQWNLGNPNEGLRWADRLDNILDTFAAARPERRALPIFLIDRNGASNLRIDALLLLGRYPEAEANLLKLMAEQEKTAGIKSRLLERQRRQTHMRYAQLLLKRGDLAGAAHYSNVMRPEQRTAYRKDDIATLDNLDDADNAGWNAVIDWRSGHRDEALAEMKLCLDTYRHEAKISPDLSLPTYALQGYLQEFAMLPGLDAAQSVDYFREAIAILKPYTTSHPEVLSAHIAEANAHAGMSRVLATLHRFDAAKAEAADTRALLAHVSQSRPELIEPREILQTLASQTLP